MATAEELVVAIRSEGAGETASDLDTIEESLEDTTDQMGDQADQMGVFSTRFRGAMSAAVAGLAVATGGILSQVPVVGEVFEGFGAILEMLAISLDEDLRPALSDVSDDLYDVADQIDPDNDFMKNLGMISRELAKIAGTEFTISVSDILEGEANLGDYITVTGMTVAAATLIAKITGMTVGAATLIVLGAAMTVSAGELIKDITAQEYDAGTLISITAMSIAASKLLSIAGMTVGAGTLIAGITAMTVAASSILYIKDKLGLNATDVLSISGALTLSAAAVLAVTGVLSLPAATVIAVTGTVTLFASDIIEILPGAGKEPADVPGRETVMPSSDIETTTVNGTDVVTGPDGEPITVSDRSMGGGGGSQTTDGMNISLDGRDVQEQTGRYEFDNSTVRGGGP